MERKKYIVSVWFGGPGGVGGRRSAYTQREVISRAKNFPRLRARLIDEARRDWAQGYDRMKIYDVEVSRV